MVMSRNMIKPPPDLSTPERAPWDDIKKLIQRMDRLIALNEMIVQKPVGVSTQTGGVSRSSPIIINTPSASPTQLSLSPTTIKRPSDILVFSKEVPASYQEDESNTIRIDGYIGEVLISFPAGCKQLVEVRVVDDHNVPIVPSKEDIFIALDDFSGIFRPYYPVKSGTRLRVDWFNYDLINPHTVPTIISIYPWESLLD